MLSAMRERSGVSRKDKRRLDAPQRRAGARAKADVLPELSDLIIRFFFSEVGGAIRHAFEQVTGSALPEKFIIRLGGAPHQVPRTRERASPRGAQTGPARPPAPDHRVRGAERLRREGGPVRGQPDTKAEGKGS